MSESQGARRFNIRPDVRYRVVGGQAVIIVQDAGEAIVLNEVGTHILELIARDFSFAEMADDLCATFEVERDEAKTDLNDYLRELEQAEVVSPAPD